jgi:hypothetical protein
VLSMDKFEALRLVIENDGYGEAEKAIALAALKDLSVSSASGHERDAALSILKSFEPEEPKIELLRILFSGRSDNSARIKWWAQVRDSETSSPNLKDIAALKIHELEKNNGEN